MTNVTGAGAGNIYFCPWRITNGYLNVIGNGFVYSALANNVALNTAGAWSKSTTTLTGGASDFVFFPAGNLWVASTQSGISTTPNTGTVGAPIPPTGSFTWTSRYSTLAVYRLAVDGSNIYAFCANGTVVTSTDGLTWTVTAQQHMMPAVSASNYWTNCIYDGTRWVMSSSGPYGLVATAPTLAYGWQLVSTAEAAEANPGPYSALSVLSYTGTFGSTFTMPIVQGFGIVVGSISAGNRPVTLYGWTNATTNVAAVTGSIPSAPNAWHSYELKAVKDTTVNTFKLSLYIDGVLIGTSAAAYAIGAGTSDTTSQAFINVQASGQITQYDDMYFTIDNGTGVVGPLGVINIMAIRPSGDVQAQWTKAGSAGTNAASARVDGLSQANPANYVTTNTDGAQDQYSLDDIPTTYKVAAVMSEAYFAKIGTSAPTTSVGVVSGAVEADSTQVAIASTNFTYMSSIVEKDPNGNVAWTPSTVNALKLAINKVS
jgi:hypothetical protein